MNQWIFNRWIIDPSDYVIVFLIDDRTIDYLINYILTYRKRCVASGPIREPHYGM